MTWFRRSAHPEAELPAYADGELDERARRAVEAHLASCEACSRLLTELQDTKTLLGELPSAAPRQSFTLGAEYARPRPATPPRRMSFSFAPAVTLTVLVALLFVDAVDFSGGGADDQGMSGTANSAGASRQAAPEAGLAMEAAADSASQGGDDGTGSDAGGATAPSAIEEPRPAEEPADVETFSAEAEEDESFAAPAGEAEDTHLLVADDASDGISTLRILEIAAALAFVLSLAVVFLPRLAGRSER